jgi:hypothetical protein
MRYMVIVKATKETEAGVMPTAEELNEMGKFNAELVKAGVMLAGEGLTASSQGARVKVKGKERIVVDGPFAETKELVAGFWILQVKSKEEAIEWIKRVPNVFPNGEAELEIRRISEPEDFGEAFSPQARAAEDSLRQKIADQAKH